MQVTVLIVSNIKSQWWQTPCWFQKIEGLKNVSPFQHVYFFHYEPGPQRKHAWSQMNPRFEPSIHELSHAPSFQWRRNECNKVYDPKLKYFHRVHLNL